MAAEAHLQDITHTIQLAVAPVFLLSAIGTTLSVVTTRLGRIVDRARRVETRLDSAEGAERAETLVELATLRGRVRLIHWALSLGTSSAILVCLLIVVGFLGYLLDVRVGTAMAAIFVLALAVYVGALLSFLREVLTAIRTLRLGQPRPDGAAPPGPAAP